MKTLFNLDGSAIYFPSIFSENESICWFEYLESQMIWKHEEVKLFGKLHRLNRKISWIASDKHQYSYAQSTKIPQPWTSELISLKEKIESLAHCSFNSCLMNYYHHGLDSMGWHSDNEKSIEPNSTIASLSFGASRKFLFLHIKQNIKYELLLNSGDLLLMKGPIQNHWKHALPKMAKVKHPRINLTFRNSI